MATGLFSRNFVASVLAGNAVLLTTLANHLLLQFATPHGFNVDLNEEEEQLGAKAKEMQGKFGVPVTLLSGACGPEVEAAYADFAPGSVILLENSRLYLEEEGGGKDANGNRIKADPSKFTAFRQSPAICVDFHSSDTFGTDHRAHCSTVSDGFPVKRYGLLLAKELKFFAHVIDSPTKPVCDILDGGKVADKIQLIMNSLEKVDIMIIGGGRVFTSKEAGVDIGSPLYDAEGVKLVPEIKRKATDIPKATEYRQSPALCVDTYCSDPFGTAHGAHSSMVGDGFPVKCSELLWEKELDYSAHVIDSSTKPVCGSLDGGKVSDKIQLIMNMLEKIDIMTTGGGRVLPPKRLV